MKMLDKPEVLYRRAHADGPRCATCAMFHARKLACDLVKGRIRPDDVCTRWIPRGKR